MTTMNPSSSSTTFYSSSTTTTTSTVVTAFQIPTLLSTCIDACQRGCMEIRRVQAAREKGQGSRHQQGGTSIGTGSGTSIGTGSRDDDAVASSFQVTFKQASDPRSALTEADMAAHKVIVKSLIQEWGKDLVIIGEEDDHVGDISNSDSSSRSNSGEGDDKPPNKTKTFEPLKRDMFDNDADDLDTIFPNDIDPSHVRVFVDALDGTREFVEGRLSNCQVLIGISVHGKAVAGAIGIPFPDGDLTCDSTVVYGMVNVGTGVIGTPLRRGPYPLAHHIDGIRYPRPHYAMGDSSAVVLEACRKGVVKRFGGSVVLYGGAGNKILGTALGEVACCIAHKIGGPWDLCAPEAILKAMGGKMTDLFGNDIEIYRDDYVDSRCNEWGYLATAPGGLGVGGSSSREEDGGDVFHEAMVACLLALPEVQEYKKSVDGV